MSVRAGSLALLMVPGLALAAGPAGFDPSRDVTVAFSHGEVVLAAPPGAHLKARFLAVTVAGGGALTVGRIAAAPDRDEAGDPIYRGEVRLPVSGRGLAGTVDLDVRYQPCTEGPQGVCYLPVVRRLRVAAAEIPDGAGVALAALPAAEDLAGGTFKLASFQGSVVLLDFFASWCGPCRKSMPALDRLAGAYGPKGLKVVGVSLDEDPEALARFLESVPVAFKVLRDRSGQLAGQFQVAAMPTTLLLDRDGREVARFEGGGREGEKEAAVTALLAGRTLPRGTGSTLAQGMRATGSLKAWDRGHLADPIMSLDGDPLSRGLWEHIHAAKEGAAGTGGAAGGGCGCN